MYGLIDLNIIYSSQAKSRSRIPAFSWQNLGLTVLEGGNYVAQITKGTIRATNPVKRTASINRLYLRR